MPRINEILDAEAANWWELRPDPQIIEKLVNHYETFAHKIAQGLFRKISHRSLEWEEVAATAMFGLLQAIHRYNPDSAASFTSYATWRVRGEVIGLARSHDWVPHSARSAEKACGVSTIPLMLGLRTEDNEVLWMPDREFQEPYIDKVPQQYHRAIKNILNRGLYMAAQLEGVSTGMLTAVLRGKLKAVLIGDC